MPVPKATVNEYGSFVFRKNNIRPHEPTPDPSAAGNFSARAIWHPCPFAYSGVAATRLYAVFICDFILSFDNGDPGV